MSTTIISPQLVAAGVDLGRVDAARRHPLGMEVPGRDGCVYRYVLAGGVIAADNFLTRFAGLNIVVQTTAVDQPIVGIAPVAIADTRFGWIKVKGVHANANVTAGDVTNNSLASTAVAGRAGVLVSAANLSNAEGLRFRGAVGGVSVRAVTDEAANRATVELS